MEYLIYRGKVRSFDTQTYLQVYVYVTLFHGSLQVSPIRSDELGSDARDVAEWKSDEVASGRWILPDADEESASELLARRSFAMIDAAEADVLDTDRLTLCIGLFCYCAAFCIPSFDAKSFRRLFVLAWFKYFSTVLSLENNDAPAGKDFNS